MAVNQDISIECYTTVTVDLYCKNTSGVIVDLTGYSAVACVRTGYGSADPIATFTATITASSGLVRLSMSKTETAKMQGYPSGVWDCFVTDGSGNVTKLAYGKVTITPAVSRP